MIGARTSKRRTVFAFLGAPLIVPFVFYLPFPGESAGTGPVSLIGPLIFAPYALAISYLAELLLGVPAWKVFQRYGIRSLPAFAGAGALMGWLVNLGMEVLTGSLATKPLRALFDVFNDPYISICIVAGAASAILFRLIVFSGSQSMENST